MTGAVTLTLGAVAEIRLDNPTKLNALTVPMLAALMEHCAAIERARDVRAVVLSAAPARAGRSSAGSSTGIGSCPLSAPFSPSASRRSLPA